MEFKLKEKITKEKKKDGEIVRIVSKRYVGKTDEGVVIKIDIKGKESEVASYEEMLDADI